MSILNLKLYKTVKENDSYEVSLLGIVRNKKTKHILMPFIIGAGYEAVKFCNKGEVKICYVHRLVGEAFLESNGLREINHKDEDKKNNYYGNLEYCTHRYNCNYGTRMSRIRSARKAKGGGT